MNDSPVYQKCAAQHFGAWMIEPRWFQQAVNAVKAGTYTAEAPADEPADKPAPMYQNAGGIARISLAGQMTKGGSSFGGASSVRMRQAVRAAVADDSVHSILLHIDSPGGTVAGTGDLAADVRAADKIKPVYTYFEDLGASAAYWVGSQGRKVYANPTAEIGSIGTMTYLEDTSGAYEKAGIKVHLVSTGKYKGAWVDGLEVSDDYIKTVQTEIDDLNEHFLAGVLAGRKGMTREQLMGIADGRVFIADKAKQIGLIDEVSTLDAVMAAISKESYSMTREQFDAFAVEHPEAVASYVDQGKKAGHSSAVAEFKAIREACGDNLAIAVDAFETGQSVDSAKSTVAAVAKARADEAAKYAGKDAEIAALKAQVEKAQFVAGSQGAVGTGVAADKEPEAKVYGSPKEQAEAEFEASAEIRQNYMNKSVYVAGRVAELNGRVSISKGSKQPE
jgi:signal peptide peptidase SppA